MRMRRVVVCVLACACSANDVPTHSEDGGSGSQDARRMLDHREPLENARPSVQEVNRMMMDLTSGGIANGREDLLRELVRRGASWPNRLMFYLEASERGPAVWGYKGVHVPDGDGFGVFHVLVCSSERKMTKIVMRVEDALASVAARRVGRGWDHRKEWLFHEAEKILRDSLVDAQWVPFDERALDEIVKR